MEEIVVLILRTVLAIFLLFYAGFCWVKQGVHVRGKGWKTREEAPKTFWFCIGLYILGGVSVMLGIFLDKWLR